MSWFREIFNKDSEVSSKRVIGVILVFWSIIIATVYAYKILFDPDKENTQLHSVISLVEMMTMIGCALLAGGNLVEKLDITKINDKTK